MTNKLKTIPITSRHSKTIVDWLEAKSLSTGIKRATLISNIIKSMKKLEDAAILEKK
jgi:hypothetical protein